MQSGSDNDIITALITDHREVEQMFAQLEQLGPDAPERRQLTEQVITELVRHSVAEEAHLYPPRASSSLAATRSPTTRSPSTPRRSRR